MISLMVHQEIQMQSLILHSLNRPEDGAQLRKRTSRLWVQMAGLKAKSQGCAAHSAGERTPGSMQRVCGGDMCMRNTRLPCQIVVKDMIAAEVAADLAVSSCPRSHTQDR